MSTTPAADPHHPPEISTGDFHPKGTIMTIIPPPPPYFPPPILEPAPRSHKLAYTVVALLVVVAIALGLVTAALLGARFGHSPATTPTRPTTTAVVGDPTSQDYKNSYDAIISSISELVGAGDSPAAIHQVLSDPVGFCTNIAAKAGYAGDVDTIAGCVAGIAAELASLDDGGV